MSLCSASLDIDARIGHQANKAWQPVITRDSCLNHSEGYIPIFFFLFQTVRLRRAYLTINRLPTSKTLPKQANDIIRYQDKINLGLPLLCKGDSVSVYPRFERLSVVQAYAQVLMLCWAFVRRRDSGYQYYIQHRGHLLADDLRQIISSLLTCMTLLHLSRIPLHCAGS